MTTIEPIVTARPASISDSTKGQMPDALDWLIDAYYELDFDLRYRRVNEAGARIARKTRDEMIGRHVLDLFPDVATAPVHELTLRVMRDRRPESIETYFAPHHRWYVNSVYPIEGGVAILSRDITERKLLEQNLAFLAQASKILSSSLDHRLTLRNVANLAVPHIADWCAVDFFTEAGTVEMVAVAHVDPEKVAWAEELRRIEPPDLAAPSGLGKVLRTAEPEFFPEIPDELIVAVAKNERHLEVLRGVGFSSAMIVPLIAQGTVIGAITLVSAESDRHYSASDLVMAEELASRAALAIENARLFTASQEAVALRDDFISIASHELKTPVTSLRLYTEVFQRKAARRGDEGTSSYMGKMLAQIDKLGTLIGDLLDVSKIESGKLEFEMKPIDLNAVVAETVESIQPTAPKHVIERHGAIDGPVVGDRDRLSQVVTNLLTNAVKYSPKADRVIVRLREEHDAVIAEVEDFGIGMDPEHLPHLFDRFYRIDNDDEKTFPGLGMGLFISNEIMRRHGGHFEVESERGRGSRFRIVLPRGGRANGVAAGETSA